MSQCRHFMYTEHGIVPGIHRRAKIISIPRHKAMSSYTCRYTCGFQLPNSLTSNCQLWLSTYSQPEYIRQLISSQHSGSSVTVTLRSSTVLYSRHHAPERHMAVVLLVQLYRPSGTIYQSQSSKRAVCLFIVADSRHICLL